MSKSNPTRKELLEQIDRLQTIHIVYPNVNSLSQFDELKYSLRSLEKHLTGCKFAVWIVGEKPEWLSDKANFIPVETSGKSPRVDVAIKRQVVDATPEINDTYYWMNDDIYLVNPVTVEDLGIPTVLFDMEQRLHQYDPQTPWGKDIHHTYEELLSEGYSCLHAATHLPHKIEKQYSRELIKKYRLTEVGHVFELLYYNIHQRHLLPYRLSLDKGNNILFSVNRPNPNWDKVEEQLLCKKFMNNGEPGKSDRFIELLERLFPEKSAFEL